MNLLRTSTLKQLTHILVTASMLTPNLAFAGTQSGSVFADNKGGGSECDRAIDQTEQQCKSIEANAEKAIRINSNQNSFAALGSGMSNGSGTGSSAYNFASNTWEKAASDCEGTVQDCENVRNKCKGKEEEKIESVCKRDIKQAAAKIRQKAKDGADVAKDYTKNKELTSDSASPSEANPSATTPEKAEGGDTPADPAKSGPIAGSGGDAKPVPPPADSGNTASQTQEKPSSALANGNMNKGMGNPMSALGPLMGLAAMMMGQNQGGQKPPQPQANGYASPDGVWDASGKPNCGATYAYRWTVCNTQLAQSCMKDLNTMIGSPVCQQFSARYCNMGYTPQLFYSACPFPAQAGQTCGNSYYTASAPIGQSQVDIVGEGLVGGTSGYCLRAAQINYCSDPGNTSCPSCMALQSLTNPACANNPACNVSSSTQLVANQLAACPVPGQDPLVATGLIQNTGVPIAANPITIPVPINGSAPPAILPASAGGLKVASLAGRAPAARQQTFGDVAPEFGQNLFSAGSAPIDRRCQTASLNHCSR